MSSGKERFAAALNVSRETLERFETYEALLQKWNKTINLVARSTLEEVWTRHFLDSAAIFSYRPDTATRWVDMGSGGGFPGAIVAILAAEKSPELTVTCIEADIRKASFLRTLAIELGITMHVASRRIEEMPPQNADVVSARALSSLSSLLAYAEKHMAPSGTAIFSKGENWRSEVEEALETFRFSVENHDNPSNPGSAILVIGDIARA